MSFLHIFDSTCLTGSRWRATRCKPKISGYIYTYTYVFIYIYIYLHLYICMYI